MRRAQRDPGTQKFELRVVVFQILSYKLARDFRRGNRSVHRSLEGRAARKIDAARARPRAPESIYDGADFAKVVNL